MRYPGFFGPSYKSASYMADSEELINLYPEKNETPNAPTPYCYLGTPGFEEVAEVNEGPHRGACIANGLTYFVAGVVLYEWDGVTATNRGTLVGNGNPATLCWNGTAGGQLFVTSGDQGYILDLTSFVLTTVLTSGATMGAYLDGYFLAVDAATGGVAISDLLDGLTWDPTQIAFRSGAPDSFIAMTVLDRTIWLSGNRTSEPWVNAGTIPYPFEPIPNIVIPFGTAAPFSSPRDVAPMIWLAANAAGGANEVRMLQGYDAVRVSTHALEAAIGSYAIVNDAWSFSFQDGGHTFYALIFPSEDICWLYDVTEGAWLKWLYWDTTTSTWQAVRVGTHVYTDEGVHLVGDRASGALYRMGLDLYTDVDGALILRERTPPRISAPGQVRFTVPSIQLVMDVGVGLSGSDDTDPSVNPQAMHQYSKNGGKTWSPERWAPIGKIGEYDTRVIWTQCGQARNRVDRFRFAAACPIRIADAEIEIRAGTS